MTPEINCEKVKIGGVVSTLVVVSWIENNKKEYIAKLFNL